MAEVQTALANRKWDVQCASIKRMSEDWPMIHSLWGGTKAMRAAGNLMLPQNPNESDENYKVRLAATTLTPFFKSTITHLVGRVFNKPLNIIDADEAIVEMVEDVDRTGRHFNIFAQDLFETALRDGISFILVDFPKSDPMMTRAQETEAGVRPYWIHVDVRNILWIKVDSSTNQIAEVRLLELAIEYPDRWTEVVVRKVRCIMPGSFELWREVKGATANSQSTWILEDSGPTTMGVVPLIPVYCGRIAPFEAIPPLLDLAYLNACHYQMRSNYQNGVTVAQFPMLAASGLTSNEKDIVIGPKKLLRMQSETGRFYYVEHSGAALQSGRDYLDMLKEEMAAQGMRLLMPRSVGPKGAGSAPTATGEEIADAEAKSELQKMAFNLCDSLENALEITAKWMGIEGSSGSVVTTGDFGILRKDANDVTNLINMKTAGDITPQTFYTELIRRGFLSEAFDVEAEIEKLDEINSTPDLPGAAAPSTKTPNTGKNVGMSEGQDTGATSGAGAAAPTAPQPRPQ